MYLSGYYKATTTKVLYSKLTLFVSLKLKYFRTAKIQPSVRMLIVNSVDYEF